MVFDSAHESKEVLKRKTDLWNEIKDKTETINGGKAGDYKKDLMKIKFISDDDLP